MVSYEPLPQRILMGPGPSNVNARVLQALALPTIGHLDPAFTQLMENNQKVAQAIEQGWADQHLPTFKTYLREDLARRAKEATP